MKRRDRIQAAGIVCGMSLLGLYTMAGDALFTAGTVTRSAFAACALGSGAFLGAFLHALCSKELSKRRTLGAALPAAALWFFLCSLASGLLLMSSGAGPFLCAGVLLLEGAAEAAAFRLSRP